MTERFTGKVSGRNMVSNGIYGMIGKRGRYFVGEAIDKPAEYETAEEEGRLVILPKCKIGDRVYLPIDFENKIYSGKVHGYMYFEPRKEWVVKIRLDGTEIQYCHEPFKDFGKTFFLDYEEAEKALEDIEKDE